jgi:hypothetical protein
MLFSPLGLLRAAEGEAAVRAGAARIDEFLDARMKADGIPASPAADDAQWLRRVTVDLIGRVPTIAEAETFLDDRSADKRTRLVEHLLAREEYGRHLAHVWRRWMMDEEQFFTYIRAPDAPALERWLAQGFNENRPWDRTVRAILEADGSLPDHPEAIFYQLHADPSITPEPGLLGKAAARLFLGQRFECAECHDHPFRELTQAQYWGLAAFFARVTIGKGASTEKGKDPPLEIREAPGGYIIKSNNIGDRKILDRAALAIPKSAFKGIGNVVPAAFPLGDTPPLDMSRPLRPVLAEWMLGKENPWFAKAAVNRLWAQLFGRGLVEPLDDLHSDNPPSHPELLQYLADEFARSGHDLKHLLRILTETQAYRRSSASVPGNEKDRDHFARMAIKPLAADSLLDSLLTVLEVDEPAFFAAEIKERKGSKAMPDPWEATPRLRFLDQFALDELNPAALRQGIPQLLRRLNDPALAGGGKLIPRLLEEKRPSDQIIGRLHLAALARRPSPDEAAELLAFAQQAETEREGYARALWLLLCSGEFLLVQ